MEHAIKQILMSKAVAETYLKRVGQVTFTLTVYSSDDSQLASFARRMSKKQDSKFAHVPGFDHMTFITEDREVAQAISDAASSLGMIVSGF
jgi:hypothetical protein